MQKTEQSRFDGVLVLMGILCLLVGFLIYIIATQSDQVIPEDIRISIAEVTSGEISRSNEEQSLLAARFVAGAWNGFRGRFFDFELTDIMAPLPMEGVVPAGVFWDND